MPYVASQIVLWMTLAMVFGFAVGYLVRGRRTARRKRKLPTAGRR